jgi:hypothetical protein
LSQNGLAERLPGNWVRFVDGIQFFARDRREEVRLLGF